MGYSIHTLHMLIRILFFVILTKLVDTFIIKYLVVGGGGSSCGTKTYDYSNRYYLYKEYGGGGGGEVISGYIDIQENRMIDFTAVVGERRCVSKPQLGCPLFRN